jgi:hypothetical protein
MSTTQIVVKWSNKEYPVELQQDDTVANLKRLLQEKTQVLLLLPLLLLLLKEEKKLHLPRPGSSLLFNATNSRLA